MKQDEWINKRIKLKSMNKELFVLFYNNSTNVNGRYHDRQNALAELITRLFLKKKNNILYKKLTFNYLI